MNRNDQAEPAPEPTLVNADSLMTCLEVIADYRQIIRNLNGRVSGMANVIASLEVQLDQLRPDEEAPES
jgi:hypothetical protein